MADALATTGVPTPVMDVVAPPAEKKSDPAPTPSDVDPVDQLAAADQKTQQTLSRDKTEPPAKSAKKQQPANRQTESTHRAGVGLAITATVIIVLGLAALATYAYLQTNK